jgi:hypothetical protein
VPVVVLGASLLVGCGDDGGDSSDTLTETEFEEQANAICEEGNAEIDAGADETFSDVPSGEAPSEVEQTAFVEDVVVPGVQDQIDGIRALAAPEDIQDDVDAAMDDAEAVLDDLEEDPSLLFGEDDPFDEINPQLEELGLDACV